MHPDYDTPQVLNDYTAICSPTRFLFTGRPRGAPFYTGWLLRLSTLGEDRKDLAGQRVDASRSNSSRSGREQMNSTAVRQGAKKSQ